MLPPAWLQAAVATGEGIVYGWTIKYLYDAECPMCQSLKLVLERQDRRKAIRFVDISDLDYNPSANMGIEFEEAMDTIHAVRPDGTVLLGTDALRALFDTVGWVGLARCCSTAMRAGRRLPCVQAAAGETAAGMQSTPPTHSMHNTCPGLLPAAWAGRCACQSCRWWPGCLRSFTTSSAPIG